MNDESHVFHSFTLILAGADPLTRENLDRLFEAGCDDATFGAREGLFHAEFDREATSFAEAIRTAIRDVEGAVPGLKVIRVEPEEFVTAADIARRIGRSRESVRLLIRAERGPGFFPPPAWWIGGKRPIWRWSDVATWCVRYLNGPPPTGATDEAVFISAMNGALDVRRHGGALSSGADRALLADFVDEDARLLRA